MSLSSPIEVSDTEGVKWSKLQRFFQLIADNAGITYTMSGFLTPILPRETEGVKWAKLGAWAQLIAGNISGGLPPTSVLQVGSEPLVIGQQSYVITFPVPFAGVPRLFIPSIKMPDQNGELFTLGDTDVDRSAIDTTVWLGGLPTALSTGGEINWIAIL